MKLLWKVCGMRDEQNIKDVAALQPDFMGFIFFKKSKRFVGDDFDAQSLHSILSKTKKVGVFVNEDPEVVRSIVSKYKLDFVQLHGHESAEECNSLKESGIRVFKAFAVDEDFDFSILNEYQGKVDYFLFDTKAKGGFGGHGITFDWSLLEQYSLNTPFLLAGGIDLGNIPEVKELNHKMLAGIDVNSKFEIEPAFKNIEMLRDLKGQLKLF
ncbi:phosphoribosylanthranilate isomerase [Jiulongibacter sediminis]|uniref:phosphoribosylanthranilate isomerase n=1 Tax=Jiulongibacter sediminis TaxID=1605367 RepID=UPI0026F266A0|nr:phosphoribosylanthranilate isomerase [Jiulongibacter sediminis]